MKLYEKILYCRKRAGMSQETLAEKLGVSRQAISKWECGTAAPELENLLAISKLFGVTTDWLLNDAEEIGSEEKSEEEKKTVPEQPKTVPPKASDSEWINHLPKSLAKGVKRFGWLIGVYISFIGACFAGFGGLMRFIVNRMVSGVSSSVTSFGQFGTPQIEISGDIPAGLEEEIIAEIYGSGNAAGNPWEASRFEQGADLFEDFAANNPVSILGGFLIFVGVVMIIGGIVLALWLRHLSKKNS